MARVYDRYVDKMQKIATLGQCMAVLAWDKEVNLPVKGNAARANQMATLSGILHQEYTDPAFGELLTRLSNMKSLSAAEKKNVSVTHQDYLKAKKLSHEFVVRRSNAISNCYNNWIKARAENDYAIYENSLQEIIDIKREEVEKLGYKDHPYDTLLDEYEPGLTVATLEPLFAGVKKDLRKLIKKINKQKQVKTNFLEGHFDKDKQWEFGLSLLDNMGYDSDGGRQDIAPHPFSTNLGPGDVRVTTRIDENDFCNMTWSTIHEGGHALYEQGLDESQYGLPTGSYLSLSIHESQSRLWENHVGRGKDYWKYHYPKLQEVFPKAFKKTSLNDFYKGVNKIAPNNIRTEADELHYHFHVLIRFEIERDIMAGKLNASDLKQEWNKKYKDYLGVKIKSDNEGVLQDVHWSHGSFGYFPTYSLGSFYAAQFFVQAIKDEPSILKQIKKGKHSKLLKWLRDNIHVHGRRYEAAELCKKVTGEELNFKYFLEYAKAKYGGIYGL